MTTRSRLTLLAVLLLFQSASAWSLGLGDARVQSFIGQPLELHIDLLTSPNDNLDSVTARLASAEDFALIGAKREAISVPLQFMIQEAREGSGPIILVTSRLAVHSPVLRLVAEVNWSSGRLLREYTIFLDPPTLPSQAPEPVVSSPEPRTQAAPDPTPPAESAPPPEFTDRPPPPPIADQIEDVAAEVESQAAEAESQAAEVESQAAEVASTTTDAEDIPAEAEAEPETAVAQSTEPRVSASEVYGPVQNGETLWRIASSYVGQTNMDMNQVMLAIQRKNPNAFMRDNINLLKRGAVLEMPAEDEVDDITRSQARELVAQHEAAFRMRSSLASTSTPLLASESRTDSNGTSEDEFVAEPAEETVARLEIVPASEEDLAGGEPGTGAVPGGEGSDEVEGDVREELARTEEALISAQQENTYLQERISELEAQLAETAGVSEGTVADEELSNLEDRLQAERLAEAAATEEEETDSRIPSVTTTSSGEEDAPWYSGPMTWIIMVIIVIAAVIGWIFNRRRNGEQFATDSGESTVAASGLKGEAEEILRTLDADAGVDQADDDTVVSAPVSRDDAEEETTPDSKDDDAESGQREVVEHKEEAQVEPIIPMGSIRPRRRDDEIDATVLDENSSDPEIKLDLARAYISMGDKEAARAILDEVLNMGNKQQQAEARSMMDEI